MAVAQHPTLVEVGGLLLADLAGDFVEGFGLPGSHGEGDGNLLLSQQVGSSG